jgi:hypothetical protein
MHHKRKLYQVFMGFAQNLIQCKSTLQVNKNNRKHNLDGALVMMLTIFMKSLRQKFFREGLSR